MSIGIDVNLAGKNLKFVFEVDCLQLVTVQLIGDRYEGFAAKNFSFFLHASVY